MVEAFAGRNQLSRWETIRDLLFAGLQVRDIIDVTGYSRSQIRRVADRIANGRGMDRRPGSGRLHQNSAVGMEYLDAITRQHGRWLSKTMARSLEQDFPDEAVTDRTVRRILHRDLNFKYGKLWRKFNKLTELHKDNRVDWCLLHSHDDWEQTIFLDESCFALTPNGVRSWYPANNRAPIFEAEQFPKNCTFLALFRRSERLVPLCSLSRGSRGTLSVSSRL